MRKSSDLLDQILTSGPSQSTIFLVLTAMKEEGRNSEVIQGCLKALDIYPHDIRLRKLLAESYHEAGFVGPAEAQLAGITPEIDDLTSVYKLQARIFAQQMRLEEAFEALSRYLALNPDDREGLALLEKIKPAEVEAEPEEEPVEAEPLVEAVEPEPAAETIEAKPEVEPAEEEPVAELHEPGPVPEEQEFIEEAAQPAEIEEHPEEALVDLATPTLAELYFSQGQIREAMDIYEKVLLNNPDDKASEQRLAELEKSVAQEAEPLFSEEDVARAKTEKTIGILENWVTRIQAMGNG